MLGFLAACVEDESEAKKDIELSWSESTFPENDLPVTTGSFTIDVNWAYTQWIIKVEEVLEGDDFIEDITPRVAGSENFGNTTTRVAIRYKANESYSSNKIRLTLQASDGSGQKFEKILTQLGQEFTPLRINLNQDITHQKISGFGGGNMMWGTDFLSVKEIQLAYGTGTGELGLSIYRIRISPIRSDWPAVVNTVKEAKKHGAVILASPWSPPASMKSNNDLVGGYLLEENYDAYAQYLNDFVQFMAGEGAAVDIVSMQNEPDIQVSYESCDWTIPQILNFVKNHAQKIQGAKFTASESFNFNQSYTDQLLNDPEALANLDLVSGHIYGSGLAPYPLAEQKGVEVWMTEYLMNQNSGADINNWNRQEAVIWEETMGMLQTIHTSMISNWNAYIWWYIRRFYSFLGEGEQGTTREQTLRRGDAMAQFSKHVRPGYTRFSSGISEQRAIDITAYKGDNKIVIVLINKEESSIPALEIELPENYTSAKATVTSLNHRQNEVSISTENRVGTLELASKSITTIVIE
ncbi:glucuronoarabinoxylan endo-1,4-beta-xylanase XynC [Belliella aquatica]|uniref:Glucuronoxylanase XynC n=2 Tax=Belliella aquatica TaxID=1323734 RepID=A0ABQ1MH28_9BACT|nr:glucuronoxylanase XynC [Belliella aquatica]